MKKNKRLFALLLSLVLVLSSAPLSTFAETEIDLTATSDLSSEELEQIYDEENYENDYNPGEVIVGLNEDNEVDVETFEEDVNADISVDEVEEIETFGVDAVRDTLVVTLEDKSEEAVLEAIVELKNDPNIAYAEPNYKIRGAAIPNDSYYNYYDVWGMERIEAPSAWDVETGDSSVMVAVIDSGIDYTHPDLADNVDESLGYDFVNNDDDAMDDEGHGTKVAGAIGAVGNNGIGTAGVCWNITMVPIKILDDENYGEEIDVAYAIYYAASLDISIINASIYGDIYLQALEDAIEAYDGLVVACAGNDSLDTDSNPQYPTSFDSDNIISVAAIDQTDSLVDIPNRWGSNYGKTSVDLGSPGASILTTAPDNRYVYSNGTSLATPLVTGAAALILSHYNDLTTAELKEAILESVDKVDALDGKCVSGGILNVAKALNYAKSFDKLPSVVQYRVSTYEDGWGDWVSNGEIAGTPGVKINAVEIQMSDGLTFRGACRGKWVGEGIGGYVEGLPTGYSTNQIIGPEGRSYYLYYFMLEPSPTLTESYNFKMRFCAGSEWSDWSSGGEASFGTSSSSSGPYLEAIQIEIT